MITVGELRRFLAGYEDDTPVLVLQDTRDSDDWIDVDEVRELNVKGVSNGFDDWYVEEPAADGMLAIGLYA